MSEALRNVVAIASRPPHYTGGPNTRIIASCCAAVKPSKTAKVDLNCPSGTLIVQLGRTTQQLDRRHERAQTGKIIKGHPNLSGVPAYLVFFDELNAACR